MRAAAGLAMAATASRPVDADPRFPDPSGPLVDTAHLLKSSTTTALSRELRNDNRSQTAQLGVATVATTGGEPIERYALELFNRWGVGHRGANDGMLLVVAAEDHTLRI